MKIEVIKNNEGKSFFDIYPETENDGKFLLHYGFQSTSSFSDMRAVEKVETKIKGYDIKEHRHRFAIWSAARAVQSARKKIKTQEIDEIIKIIKLKDAADEKLSKINLGFDEDVYFDSSIDFEQFHFDYTHKIMKELSIKASYGFAAKILAVYLKVYAVIPNPHLEFSKLCHPPIDSRLLKNLKSLGITINKNLCWSKMSEKEYWELLKTIQEKFYDVIEMKGFWALEFLWSPSDT